MGLNSAFDVRSHRMALLALKVLKFCYFSFFYLFTCYTGVITQEVGWVIRKETAVRTPSDWNMKVRMDMGRPWECQATISYSRV